MKKEQIANNLRALADLVEKCEVNDSNIEIHQFSKKEGRIGDSWNHFLKTGQLMIDIHLSLYDPERDDYKNGKLDELHKSEEE